MTRSACHSHRDSSVVWDFLSWNGNRGQISFALALLKYRFECSYLRATVNMVIVFNNEEWFHYSTESDSETAFSNFIFIFKTELYSVMQKQSSLWTIYFTMWNMPKAYWNFLPGFWSVKIHFTANSDIPILKCITCIWGIAWFQVSWTDFSDY